MHCDRFHYPWTGTSTIRYDCGGRQRCLKNRTGYYSVPSDTRIDTLDYAILQTVMEPLWKSKIRAALEQQDDLPVDDVPSPQTIGRRVETLTETGHLATTIIAPDETTRDLIIGYMRTRKGDETVADKREAMLRELAYTASNPSEEDRRTATKPVLVRMITEQFDLNADTMRRLDAQYETERLLSLLALHYAQKDADDLAPDDQSYTHHDDAQNFKELLD